MDPAAALSALDVIGEVVDAVADECPIGGVGPRLEQRGVARRGQHGRVRTVPRQGGGNILA
ncbi:hypothetical protein [Mycobacterium kiyosense]